MTRTTAASSFLFVLLRSVLIGAIYALARLVAAVLLDGWPGAVTASLPMWLVGGTLTGLVLAPFLTRSVWPPGKAIWVTWISLAVIGPIGLGIEGYLFTSMSAGEAVAGGLIGSVIRLLVAWLAVVVLRPADPSAEVAGWTWPSVRSIVLGGLAYIGLYFVFGAANFLLYTGPFYQSYPEYGLNLPEPAVVFLAQGIRAPLMALGAGLMAGMAPGSRRSLGLRLGFFLFVIGGMGPYVEEVFLRMPLGFNLATLAELFLQNFTLGLVLARGWGTRAVGNAPAA